ncbi:hypothetical protein ACWDV7_25615 [Streptomyces sp. NPDC003362]
MKTARAAEMPRQVRAAQLLLYVLGVSGLIVVLALSDGMSSYGLGELMAPWLLVWLCALLALTYEGSAKGGIRLTTIVVMVFVLLGSAGEVADAAAPGEFLDAALRIALGLPVVVCLFLPEATDWFERER